MRLTFTYVRNEVVFLTCLYVLLLYTYSMHQTQAQSRADVSIIPICYVIGGCSDDISTLYVDYSLCRSVTVNQV